MRDTTHILQMVPALHWGTLRWRRSSNDEENEKTCGYIGFNRHLAARTLRWRRSTNGEENVWVHRLQ